MPASGEVPLTPVQCWFFEQAFHQPDRCALAVMVELDPRVDPARLFEVLQQLPVRHDALRLRFSPVAGGWTQQVLDAVPAVPLETRDLSGHPSPDDIVAGFVDALRARLDLSKGLLLCAGLCEFGAGRPRRLLLVGHHLAVDAVSWRILIEDLEGGYRALDGGEAPPLPAATTPFATWARALADHVRAGAHRDEVPYWAAVGEEAHDDRPARNVPPRSDESTFASDGTVSWSLVPEATSDLLRLAAGHRLRIDEILLWALARALSGWAGRTSVLVELEGIGRESGLAGADLTRTVGWFTSVYPVRLEAKLDHPTILGLKSIKAGLREVPNHGLGFGLLRYLSHDPDTRDLLAALPPADASFLYLGRLDMVLPASSLFRLVWDSGGTVRATADRSAHAFDVTAAVSGDRLQVSWAYSPAVHRRSTVEELSDRFGQAVRAAESALSEPGVTAWTPADFPESGLSQQRLDKFFSSLDE